ncbi:MAG TPA: hypothetical protein VEF76_09605 [Patescibacteria group bacterium]|nr:hypothetical protein [Patescibacteria group bacterium]
MSEAAPNTTYIQPIPMIQQDDPYTIGSFVKGLFALVVVMAVAGELAYDGDFTSTHAGPQQVMRSCVQTFRHHPLAMSLEADISPAAMPFEGLTAAAVAELLEQNHFRVMDDTRRYADKMVYNDRALRATRSASRFWPEIFRKDSCEVTLFMKDGVISGATAVAVREPRIPLPRMNFTGVPSFSGLQNAVTSSVNY